MQDLLSGWISPFRLGELGIMGMNRRNISYISRYNPRHRYPFVDNKLKTKVVAQKARLRVPDLLHVVETQHEIESIDNQIRDLNEFVIKPAQGSGGKGILVIVGRDGDQYVKSSGARLTLADIKRHVTNILSGLHSLGGRPDIVLIEGLVKVSPYFSAISYEGVPDIRIIVFKGYPVMGMLRLATHASDGKANLHQGAVGVGIDIATGRSVAAVKHNQLVTHHPDTGESLQNLVVPDWHTMLLLASRCYEVTGLGYLGCDIVVDAVKGPLLLELNARPGLSIQIANNRGLLARLRHVEGLEDHYLSHEDRVAYAVANFRHYDDAPADHGAATPSTSILTPQGATP
ncbi:MAG TPA: alpha-L-glutamate ligase-like protein [Gammaproteobacteria bacterium]|nr:alpha-L-glutamate ligase-like protein [Gammaproteobacteria bacterium]